MLVASKVTVIVWINIIILTAPIRLFDKTLNRVGGISLTNIFVIVFHHIPTYQLLIDIVEIELV